MYSVSMLREGRSMKQKRADNGAPSLAGRGGFEPPVDTRPTTVFETVPFNHSGTFPIISYHVGIKWRRDYIIPRVEPKFPHLNAVRGNTLHGSPRILTSLSMPR